MSVASSDNFAFFYINTHIPYFIIIPVTLLGTFGRGLNNNGHYGGHFLSVVPDFLRGRLLFAFPFISLPPTSLFLSSSSFFPHSVSYSDLHDASHADPALYLWGFHLSSSTSSLCWSLMKSPAAFKVSILEGGPEPMVATY